MMYACQWLWKTRYVGLVVLCFGLLTHPTLALASGPSAVYALVDRVEYEPNQAQATKVRVYGFFSLADPNDQVTYLKPVSGYMYLDCDSEQTTLDRCRVEWGDIAKLAANAQKCASFGDRFQNPSKTYRIRPLSEAPSQPDRYTPRWGLGVQEVEFGVCQDVKNAKQAATEPQSEPTSPESQSESAAEPTQEASQETVSEPTQQPEEASQGTDQIGQQETTTNDASTTESTANTEPSGQESTTSPDTAGATEATPETPSQDNPPTTDTTPETSTVKMGCSCHNDPKEAGLSLLLFLMILVLLRWGKSPTPQRK